MVVCAHIPRFELVIATADGPADGPAEGLAEGLAEGRGSRSAAREALAGRALAVAPLVGSEQRLGEVSGAAEACGVGRGMLLGEALARCPELVLVPGDPVRVAEAWEQLIVALESIGAQVEPAAAGTAYFEAGGLEGIHGGFEGTLGGARRALARPVRIGAGPTRFCALAAALAARSGRPLLLDGRDARRWLAGRPVNLLSSREQTEALVAPLQRLGVRTLGELAKLGRGELSDRFGAAGALAHDLACAKDGPLRPRRSRERLAVSMEVGDASSGAALQRVLGVLVNRLLARHERRGRTLRTVVLSARLVAGGGWRERVVLRQALGDPERIRLALSVRLLELPAPAGALQLAVERFGPPASEQGTLLDQSRSDRAARLREAVAQIRAVAGQEGALRAVCVDPRSRVPERRAVLAPIPE
jgi:protein ImuB